MTKEEQLAILKELLANLKAMEHYESHIGKSHFPNRRRIGEIEEKIAKFK